LAIIILFLFQFRGITPFALLGVGIFEIGYQIYYRHKWISDRMSNRATNEDVEIVFNEDEIVYRGPYGSGSSAWEGFQRAILTPNGIFIYPERGIHIYIPDSALSPKEAKLIIADKINKIAESGGAH
jgi:hypothetical protein